MREYPLEGINAVRTEALALAQEFAARRLQVLPTDGDRTLIVEVCGDTHDAAADVKRDAFLPSKGFTTLRFTNAEVGKNIEGVLETVLLKLRALHDRFIYLPPPSLQGTGA